MQNILRQTLTRLLFYSEKSSPCILIDLPYNRWNNKNKANSNLLKLLLKNLGKCFCCRGKEAKIFCHAVSCEVQHTYACHKGKIIGFKYKRCKSTKNVQKKF